MLFILYIISVEDRLDSLRGELFVCPDRSAGDNIAMIDIGREGGGGVGGVERETGRRIQPSY